MNFICLRVEDLNPVIKADILGATSAWFGDNSVLTYLGFEKNFQNFVQLSGGLLSTS